MGARPAPEARSSRCKVATRSKCCCRGETSWSGSTVVRSLLPLLFRTDTVREARSMSFTRKVMHSCTRNPAP